MGRQHPVRNSRRGKVGIAVDVADGAAHVVGSMGQILGIPLILSSIPVWRIVIGAILLSLYLVGP